MRFITNSATNTNRYSRHEYLLATFFALSAAAGLIFGCSGHGQSASSNSRTSPAATAAADLGTSGSVTGVVKLEGPPPALGHIDMSAAPACVKANASPVTPPQVVLGENNALADVVVYVKSGLGGRHFDPPKTPVTLDQKACMYEPHVIALMTNQPLEVRNEDPTAHNIHLMDKVNQRWNQSQPPDSPILQQSFAKPELAMAIACNVHPWMRAYAFVFDHPYFAVTAKNGMFELKDLPPGTYTIEAWQERYGTQDQVVTITQKEVKSISFVFKSA